MGAKVHNPAPRDPWPQGVKASPAPPPPCGCGGRGDELAAGSPARRFEKVAEEPDVATDPTVGDATAAVAAACTAVAACAVTVIGVLLLILACLAAAAFAVVVLPAVAFDAWRERRLRRRRDSKPV